VSATRLPGVLAGVILYTALWISIGVYRSGWFGSVLGAWLEIAAFLVVHLALGAIARTPYVLGATVIPFASLLVFPGSGEIPRGIAAIAAAVISAIFLLLGLLLGRLLRKRRTHAT
jgi:hypothetical protein